MSEMKIKNPSAIFSGTPSGPKGRQPESERELDEWLATDEGKIATMFEPVSASRWGEVGRS